MMLIEFNEEEDTNILNSQISQDSALTIYNDYQNKIAIDFPNPTNQFCYKLRSYGYVGQIPINNELILIIKPKVPIQNIFSMLEYAYHLKSIKYLDGITEYESIEDVFEYLASIFAKMVLNRNKKGLYQNYVEKSEPLAFIRGRMDIKSIASALINKSTKIECEYDDLTADLTENIILAWTLNRLLSYHIKRQDVRREIHNAYRAISGRVETIQVEPKDCINRLYNKLNEDYKPIHALCRFFLEHSGPKFEYGNKKSIPFILNMSVLFESFVAEWLKSNLPEDMYIKTQYIANLDNAGIFSFRIDLVLIDKSSGRIRAVLDTKYKRPNAPSESDIAQIIAYSVRMDTKNAFLIYPSNETKNVEFRTGNIDVRSVVFDLSKKPDEAGHEFLQMLIKSLKVDY